MKALMRDHSFSTYSADIYMFKVNNANTRATCEIYSKLTIKTRTTSMTKIKLLFKLI